MRKGEEFENGIISLRFLGDRLETHGVGIYDLATSLLAIQRMVHKAHLAIEGRLEKGAYPNRKEREVLTLQIGERRRQSDAFALVPVLFDPTTINYFKHIADWIASGIVGYYVGDVIERLRGEKNENKRLYIGSIQAEVVNIIGRIDSPSGVQAIQIGSPVTGQEAIATFTEESKQSINDLSDRFYLGPNQKIEGRVYRLYPDSLIVTIRRGGGRKVNIHLTESAFNEIRYHKGYDLEVLFWGRPRYKFGTESQAVSEFESDRVEIENDG